MVLSRFEKKRNNEEDTCNEDNSNKALYVQIDGLNKEVKKLRKEKEQLEKIIAQYTEKSENYHSENDKELASDGCSETKENKEQSLKSPTTGTNKTSDKTDALKLEKVHKNDVEVLPLTKNTLKNETDRLEVSRLHRGSRRRSQKKKNSSGFDPKKVEQLELWLIIIATLLLVIFYFFADDIKAFTSQYNDREDPTVGLQESITVTVGENYDLSAGITLYDDKTNEDDLKENLEVKSTPEFNIDIIGEYEVTYIVRDNAGNTTEAKQTVNVVPATYKLVLTVPQVDLIVNEGDSVDLMQGVTAQNDLDDTGILTSAIEVNSKPEFDSNVPGTYVVTYSVTDSIENTATATRNVVVMSESGEEQEAEANESVNTGDNVDPEISISTPDVTIAAGDSFDIMSGITVSDDISSTDYLYENLEVYEGDYDQSLPGTYTITYTVTDEAGNSASAKRIVRVTE